MNITNILFVVCYSLATLLLFCIDHKRRFLTKNHSIAMKNPYFRVHSKIAKRLPVNYGGFMLLISCLLAGWLAEPTLLFFKRAPDIGLGFQGLAFRLAMLVAAAIAMKTYQEIIRGSDREVLNPHPIQPDLLFKAIAVRTVKQTWSLPVAVWFIAWPLIVNTQTFTLNDNLLPYMWLGVLLVVTWAGMIGFGYMIHLASVRVARSPSFASTLDLIRGANPREQAAFIYAPAFAFFIMGVVLMFASSACYAVSTGYWPLLPVVFLPIILGVVGSGMAVSLAKSEYVLATAILAEIDARWANLEVEDEQQQVYLDWLASKNPELKRALRQGWRRLRIWPLGAWAVGGLAFISGWSGDLQTCLVISAVGVCFVSGIPILLSQGDPKWLDLALGVDQRKVAVARWQTAVLYAQGAIIPVVIFLRNYPSLLIGLEIVAVVCGALSTILAARFRGGMWAYISFGILLCATLWRAV